MVIKVIFLRVPNDGLLVKVCFVGKGAFGEKNDVGAVKEVTLDVVDNLLLSVVQVTAVCFARIEDVISDDVL